MEILKENRSQYKIFMLLVKMHAPPVLFVACFVYESRFLLFLFFIFHKHYKVEKLIFVSTSLRVLLFEHLYS